MISTLDIDIYNTFYQQRKITEKYVGQVPFIWNYSLVNFNADCTEGLSFDLFDKVIVGILLVDEVLNITEIGEILGMNVVHDPVNQKYRDEAEYDILRAAIDSLVDFKMVETGDIYYNCCQVTDIGREYAAKGRKFKFAGNKEFALYFDNTSGNHKLAKELFSKYNPVARLFRQSDEYLNETILKELCLAQQLDIYNPEKGNSFTNTTINRRKSFSYDLMLKVLLFFNLETNEIQFVAYDPVTKREVEYVSNWLNENQKQELLKHYFDDIDIAETGRRLPLAYSSNLITLNQEFEKALSENPQSALEIASKANEATNYVDPPYFWNNISNFIKPDVAELYLFVPEPTTDFLNIVAQLVKIALSVPLFIVIEKCEDSRTQALLSSIKEFCVGTTNSVFILEAEQIKAFAFWIVTDRTTNQYKDVSFFSEYGDKKVIIEVLELSQINLGKSEPVCKKVKNLMASEYLPLIYKNIVDYVHKQRERNENEINEKVISSHNDLTNKALVFDTLYQTEADKINLDAIKQEIQDLIYFHTEKWKAATRKKLDELTASYESKEVNDLAELSDFMVAAKAILVAAPDTFEEIIQAAVTLIRHFKEREQYIKDEVVAKTFVIDTNVFIEDPNILELINRKDYVALSFQVIEELDKLKMKDNTKDKASAASKNINQFLQKSSKEKNPRVRKTRENLKLLPTELQNKSGDNSILSIACIYKDKNPVILTNDNNLQIKAQMLSIPVLDLDTFKANIKRS